MQKPKYPKTYKILAANNNEKQGWKSCHCPYISPSNKRNVRRGEEHLNLSSAGSITIPCSFTLSDLN